MIKISRISFVILGIIVVVTVVMIGSMLTNLSDNKADPNMQTWIGYNLSWAYVLMFLAAGATVLFALFQTFSDLKASKGGLIGIGFMLIVGLVSYLLASDEIPRFLGVDKFVANGTLTSNVAKWVDTGLIACYVLLGISLVSLVFSSVSRLFE